jgi:tRNA dimethylallyltransferase
MTISSDASAADEERVGRACAIAEADPDALLAIVGPTATGKTALAVRVAETLGGEIVSADSVQIYRAFDIGSGKPSAEERRRAPHHLVDALDPMEAIDAALYGNMAERAIAELRARGKRPILCGGTFLWTKALLFGLAEAPRGDATIRERHRVLADAEGRASLHARLAAVDVKSASRLHPNDLVRVSRALEVHELTGKAMSAWQEEHAFATVRHRARLLGIACDPTRLSQRIEARVRAFLDAGWIDETRALVARGYGEARAMGAVGYREVKMHLDGALAERDLHATIVRSTRIFARRQRTWLGHADVEWLA